MQDWRISLKNSSKTLSQLLNLVGLEQSSLPYQVIEPDKFTIRATNEFIAKIKPHDPYDPLLLQILPRGNELITDPTLSMDALKEKDQFTAVPGLLHKYKSRVLLTVTGACAIHCRYCFRRHFDYLSNTISKERLNAIIDYIQQHPTINEVILSGGDPLTLSNNMLAEIISRLEQLPQLKFLRFHTRVPILIPQRLDEALITLLKNTRLKTIIVLHTNHANEIDQNLTNYLKLAHDSNITLLNQSVLLKQINDQPQILADLSYKLFDSYVLPYYLHYPDQVQNTQHFFISKMQALQIYRELKGLISGFLVPRLAIEIPAENSKSYL